MSLVNKENVLAAQYMYHKRIEVLRQEIMRIAAQGLELGQPYEAETMLALDEIEKEIESIVECLDVLKHLLWS